jgi:diguanylate cyclase (GGDEF)-like protein
MNPGDTSPPNQTEKAAHVAQLEPADGPAAIHASAQDLAVLVRKTSARSMVLLAAHAGRLEHKIKQLHQAIGQVNEQDGPLQAKRLREANRHMMQAALQAQRAAEVAACELEVATYASQHDSLTHTPNRSLMQDRMRRAMVLAVRRKTMLGLIFVDVDRFKQINDRLGHSAGDAVLRAVAHRLSACVRESDTVSRHGGDEFLVLLAELAQPEDAPRMAQKMRQALSTPLLLAGKPVSLSASFGVAVFPLDALDCDSLTAFADRAMYQAKFLGRSQERNPST